MKLPPDLESKLKQAYEIEAQYSEPFSLIDSGNLFYASNVFREAYELMQAREQPEISVNTSDGKYTVTPPVGFTVIPTEEYELMQAREQIAIAALKKIEWKLMTLFPVKANDLDDMQESAREALASLTQPNSEQGTK